MDDESPERPPRSTGMSRRDWTLLGILVVGALSVPAFVIYGPLACLMLTTEGEPLPTIDGPEDDALRDEVRCTLVIAESSTRARELTILKLPEGESETIPLQHPSTSHSTLARDGTLAYLSLRSSGLLLCVKDVASGTEETLLERKGKFTDRSSVSLSPDGAHLALLTCEDLGGFETTPGRLEIVNREGEVSRTFENCSKMRQVPWLGDGTRFVFEKEDGVHLGNLLDTADRRIGNADSPVTGDSSTLILLPRHWVPSARSNHRRYREYDVVEERHVGDLLLPGDLFGPIGFTETGLVLYEALPTTGTEQQLLGWGLTYPSAKWTIKACDPSTGRFVTLVPYYGYGRIAFGSRW